MLVTSYVSTALAYRRTARQRACLLAMGYEEIDDNGGMLWQLNRGGRQDQRIVDAIIAIHGKSLFVRIEKPVSVGPW